MAINLKNSNAFWLSNVGKIIDVPMTHIDDIRDNPEDFGLTKKYLDSIKQKYGNIYDGSKSRDVIMTDLLKNGWIRIRKVKSGYQHWTIQLYSSSRGVPRTAKKYLVNWAKKMIKANKSLGYDAVVVMDQKGNILFGGMGNNEKTIEDIYLDDSGVFESTINWKDYLMEN